jgi:hypothetical protein
MKAQPVQSAKAQSTARSKDRLDDQTRCWHRTPSGRRCKMPILRAGEQLCYQHTVEYKKADAFNLETALLARNQAFQTAQGINNALQNLYILLANNYISPRRASVLAYISSLLLRTLPAIDADRAAGIIDPTAPKAPEYSDEPGTETQDYEASGQEPQTLQAQPEAGLEAQTKPPQCEPAAAQAEEENLDEHSEASAQETARQTEPQIQPSAQSQPAAPQNPANPATKPSQLTAHHQLTGRNSPDPTANRQQPAARNSLDSATKTRNAANPTPRTPAWPKGIPEPDPTKKPS